MGDGSQGDEGQAVACEGCRRMLRMTTCAGAHIRLNTRPPATSVGGPWAFLHTARTTKDPCFPSRSATCPLVERLEPQRPKLDRIC